MASPNGIWFKCKGCGQPAGYYPEGYSFPGYHIPPHSIVHSKPVGQARTSQDQPSTIQCPVYRQLSPLGFWELHRDAERIDSPTNMEPVRG